MKNIKREENNIMPQPMHRKHLSKQRYEK
jgi:hypothetical protein